MSSEVSRACFVLGMSCSMEASETVSVGELVFLEAMSSLEDIWNNLGIGKIRCVLVIPCIVLMTFGWREVMKENSCFEDNPS